MSKIYIGLSTFTLIASISGIPAFVARSTAWGIKWLVCSAILISVLFVLAVILDDAVQEQLGLTRIPYLALLIGSALAIVTGVLIQWF